MAQQTVEAQPRLAFDSENTTDPLLPTGMIKGRITTRDGQSVAGVSVFLKEVNRGATTDENGLFTLKNVKEGTYTLQVSLVGLQTVERTVEVKNENITDLSISLAENAKELDIVVIKTQKSLNNKAVSVGKIEIAPMDLPQSISIIGQGVIRDQQAQRLSDIIKNVNGVYLATTRASTQENFSARGYAFSSSNLFKNGSRVNTGAMPEVSSLEKVEVLKGSAAILYGNVAPGGIVNMVTRQPRFDFGGEVSLRAGSFGLVKPAFDVYGPLNSKIAYRVNGTYESAQSYRDVVESERFYINPSFLFKLGNRTELLLQGDHLKHDFTPDFGIGSLNNTMIPDLPRSTYLGAEWSYAKTNQSTATATVRHQFNESWKLNVNGSFQRYTRDYFATERIQAAADGRWGRPLGRSDVRENYAIAQADLKGRFNTGRIGHTFLAGVDADRYFNTTYTFGPLGVYDTINILDPSRYVPRTDIPVVNRLTMVETPTLRFGAYAQDLLSLSEKVKLLLGVRWSWQEARRAVTTNMVTKTETLGKLKNDQAFSPRFGLVYRPLSTTSVFMSYANSFSVNSGTDVLGNALAPSIIDQFEVGVKNEFFKGRLSANLTAYRIVNNNLAQTAQFRADGVTPNNDVNLKELTGQTTSDGIELDLSAHPVEGLDVIAGYSYNYMRYTETPDAKGNYVEGERLVNTPAHTANGSVFYTLGSGKLKGLKLGATAVYIGDRWGGWNNTIGQAQNYNRLIAVDGFTTVDVSAGYSFNRISAMVKLSNLTNVYNYYVHENYSINPIPPRQLIATVSYKF
jgi:iron complex outermembrane receptor protein